MFYDNLKSICDKKNTSPTAVAGAIGMSKSNASEWKAGKSPRLDTVYKIAEHLGVSPITLIRDSKRTGTGKEGAE